MITFVQITIKAGCPLNLVNFSNFFFQDILYTDAEMLFYLKNKSKLTCSSVL